MRKFQNEDESIGPFVTLKDNYSNQRPPKSEDENLTKGLKSLWSQWEFLEIRDELLYKSHSVRIVEHRLEAPTNIRAEIFKNFQCSQTASHFGRDRITDVIKRRFYWTDMREDIDRWCKSCELCALSKPGPGLGRNELQNHCPFTVYRIRYFWFPGCMK